MAPTPETFVKDAIRSIGVQQQTTGYFPHALMVSDILFLNARQNKVHVFLELPMLNSALSLI